MVHTYLRHVPNGCEIDLTIPENFSAESLLEFIDAFIKVCAMHIIVIILEHDTNS